MSYETLAGRTAVVTGAASGMGGPPPALLAAQGARVALLARRADRLDDVAAKIRADGGQALAVAADVTDEASVTRPPERVHAPTARRPGGQQRRRDAAEPDRRGPARRVAADDRHQRDRRPARHPRLRPRPDRRPPRRAAPPTW